MSQTINRVDDLVAAHPALFGGAAPSAPSNLPPGWFGLVDQLCLDIESLLAGAPGAHLQVRQVKEKFGSLRFSYAVTAAGDGWLEDAVRTLVLAASGRSAHLCHQCGAAAAPTSHRGWFAALCGRHAPSGTGGGMSIEGTNVVPSVLRH